MRSIIPVIKYHQTNDKHRILKDDRIILAAPTWQTWNIHVAFLFRHSGNILGV